MLKEYISKPCTILACMIEDTGTVTKIKDAEGAWEYKNKGKGATRILMQFQASKKPVPGDFIIQHSKTDIYHCTADVFAAKYVVKGMVIM